jgi:hypothetical protein
MNLQLRISFSLLLFSTLFGTVLLAQESEELITDRPDQTESSRVLPGGSVQLEVGVLFERDELAASTRTETFGMPSALLRVSLTDWLELRGLVEHSRERLTLSEEIGGLDTSTSTFPWGVGAKIQLLQESGAVPETALIAHLLVPDPFKSVRPELVFTMSHSLTETFGLGYNLGAEWNLEREHLEPFYTIALGADVSDRIGTYIELFGGWDPDSDAAHSFDAGLGWLVQENLQLDLAGGAGLTEAAPDYFIGAGFSIRFPR